MTTPTRTLVAVAATATLAAVVAACYDVPSAFVCSRNDQCTAAGDPGTCEPAPHPYCSHADPSCPSGRRFRPWAGEGLSNACVSLDGNYDTDGGAPSGDGGNPPGDGGTPDLGTGCALPQLLVAAEDFTTPGGVGHILRFSLDGNGPPHPCATLTGSGGLGALVDAVAWISDTRVAAASRDRGYQLIDSTTDVVVASSPSLSNTNPVDVFPIRSTTDEQLVAVASGQAGAQVQISHVDVFAGNQKRATWTPPQLGLSTVYSMTRSLLDPRHLFATNNTVTSTAAMEVDPWGPSHTVYVDDTTTSLLTTIASVQVGTVRRTAWTGTSPYGAYFLDDNGSGMPTIAGPTTCATPPAACTLVHVVPDPTLSGRLFGLCDDDTSTMPNARYLIRFGAGGCTTIVDGRTLGANRRMFRLAVAAP